MSASIEVAGDLAALDAAVTAAPDAPAVFALWPLEGAPYLAKTALLRRRLLRLLKERAAPSRLLILRHTVVRIEYWLTGSPFESAVVHYEQARRCFPDTYLDALKLRMPPYLKIGLSRPLPRCYTTTRLAGAGALFFGPFRSRASAERFESQFLDLFQMRRCQEDFVPSPEHPGCIYGEMGMCLRPCQQVVGPDEHAREAARAAEFLRTDGKSLLEAIGRSRERLSQEMNFEEAARQHKRYEKVQEALKLRDELARDVDRLDGVAVTRSAAPGAVELWFVRGGVWRSPRRFDCETREGRAVSLDSRLREAHAAAESGKLSQRERQERLALLARWFYSTWRDGEWLPFESGGEIPYRKLVHAVSRVVRGQPNPA